MRAPLKSGCLFPAFAAAIPLLIVLRASTACAATLLPPDPSLVIGQAVSFDGFVDQTGRPFRAASADPRPWIVSPIYTHCPTTCSVITTALKDALRQPGLGDYRVLSFSFDPQETDASLAAFRERMRLPPDWVTLRAADPAALERTLRNLDFRTIQLDGDVFEHPNLIAVLDADQRVVAFLYGVRPSPAELARAVTRARNGTTALDPWRPYLFFFAAVGFAASAAAFIGRFASIRRRARVRAAVREV
jgi:protein SCO1